MKKDRSLLMDLIDGYEIPPEHRNAKGDPITGKTFFSRTVSGSVQSRAKSAVKPIETVKSSIRRFVYTSTRVYGVMLLLFGVILTVARIVLEYLGLVTGSYTALATGLLLTLFGVLLMLGDKPIGIAAESFALSDYILFEFFCVKRIQKSAVPMRGYPIGVAVGAGILLAALGVAVHPAYIVIVLGVLVFVALSLASPEFAFFFTVMILPYLEFLSRPVAILVSLLVVSAVSFLRKVAFGKRVYVFEQYDFLIIALMAFVMISGIFNGGVGSFKSSAVLVITALGYTLASNLVTNRRLADRAALAIVISAFPASVFRIVKFAVNAFEGKPKYDTVGFYSSEVFAAFLIVSVFFVLSLLAESKLLGERIVYSVILLTVSASLALTVNYFAFIALIFGALALFALRFKRISGFITAILIILPNLFFLLPSEVFEWEITRFLFGDSIVLRKDILAASLGIFARHPFIGVGVGSDEFGAEISRLGISAENSTNTFLELACEAGVFALVFFVLIIAVSIRHRSVYRQYAKNSQVRTLSKTAAAVSVALTVYASLCYIWSSASVSFIFWLVLGFTGATLRIAKREHDDRIMYYNDVVSSESSDIDVQIDGFIGKN